MLGVALGKLVDGSKLGKTVAVGSLDGFTLGKDVGTPECWTVGKSLGTLVGAVLGVALGMGDGIPECTIVGAWLGVIVGIVDGSKLGKTVVVG